MILRNARVVALDGGGSGAGDSAGAGGGSVVPAESSELVDLQVRAGRIISVRPAGTVDRVRDSADPDSADPDSADPDSAGPDTASADLDSADLDGRWVLPGLWDAHVHITQWALARRRLDVQAATSAREVVDAVVAEARRAAVPDGAFLVAAGFRDGLWPDVPTAALLDRGLAESGLPPTPVVVVSGDLHCAWLSTPALVMLDRADHPTGLLRETEWMPLMAQVDRAPAQVLDGWVHEAARAAAARGVVGVVDLEIDDNLRTWRRRSAAHDGVLRVQAGVWPEHLDGVLAAGFATGDVISGTGGLVRMGPLKVIVDGSLNTRTAWCHDPYPTGGEGDAAPSYGVLNVPPERLERLMAAAARAGLRCAIHAIGDRATGVVLDAFERTGAQGSIEHAQLLTEADVARMAALGVVASVQPEHAMDDRDVADVHWAGRTERAFVLRSLDRAGVPLTLGSDAPVAPLDPWQAIAAAVTRARDGREPWHPEQTVDVRTALRASVRGRVEVGAQADLVVLDDDPLTADGESLRSMPVAATLLDGRWTHRTV